MQTAPKNGSIILAWCVHEEDPVMAGRSRIASPYAMHLLSGADHVPNGPALIRWGGGFDPSLVPSGIQVGSHPFPDWWFSHDSDWDMAAFPVAWLTVVPEFNPA